MSTEMQNFFKREETLEDRLIAAGLGYPLSKEDAVKAYKSMLVFRTDTPEMLDCELCFGVGHDFDAGLPCVLCCEPAKPVLDLIRKNADLQAAVSGLKTGYEAYERVNAELRAECEKLRNSSSCVDDLSALVRQLVQHLRKAAPDNDLPEKAMDYLKRKGLQGSPLRNEDDNAAEREARKIYDSWAGHDGFVPWVKGDNSLKQDEARRLACAAKIKEPTR
ncbi:hypothetical protein [Pseudomonas syringae group genomosp. 3]|nr:hypothetical protein [Pseudomonas syringae group genomosp. 3]